MKIVPNIVLLLARGGKLIISNLLK